jgi:hypothetical protein
MKVHFRHLTAALIIAILLLIVARVLAGASAAH